MKGTNGHLREKFLAKKVSNLQMEVNSFSLFKDRVCGTTGT
jgi:hypothetical protein